MAQSIFKFVQLGRAFSGGPPRSEVVSFSVHHPRRRMLSFQEIKKRKKYLLDGSLHIYHTQWSSLPTPGGNIHLESIPSSQRTFFNISHSAGDEFSQFVFICKYLFPPSFLEDIVTDMSSIPYFLFLIASGKKPDIIYIFIPLQAMSLL